MNILICRLINSYTDPDMILYLKTAGHKVDELNYTKLADKYEDEIFGKLLSDRLTENDYTFVYTTNYYPVVARVCYRYSVPYAAWVYDSPPNLYSTETMEYPTNHIFMFSRYDYEDYKDKGLDTIYHLPLAVNADRLVGISLDHARYDTQISFVGSMYNSTLPVLKSQMTREDQRYLDAVIAVQLKHYGCEIVDEAITEDFVESVNKHYKELSASAMQLSKRELVYSLCEHITHIDRMALLRLCASKYDTRLYTGELSKVDERLLGESRVDVRGKCDYITEMPQVFACSDINLNPVLRANRTGMSLRSLDIMACGGFLLSGRQKELEENYSHCGIVLYDNIEEALSLVEYYMEHKEERERIAKACREVTLREFNYPKQVSRLFGYMGL